MIDIFKLTLAKYNEFQGGGVQMAVFWLSVLLLFSNRRYGGDKKISAILSYVLLFLIVFFCPLTAGIIMKYCIGELVYWRMLWLLPEVIVIAYILTRFVMDVKGVRRFVIVLGSIILIVTTGTGFYNYTRPTKWENAEKLPTATINVCKMLKQCQEQYGDAEIRVIVPDEMVCSIRQYDATIKMPYGRAVLKGEQAHIIRDIMLQTPLQTGNLVYNAKLYGCNYLVYPISGDGIVEGRLDEVGYVLVGQTNGYNIFRLDDEKEGWAMLSFPDASGNQAMFYILHNEENGSLIVVDGGWKENSQQVRDVINSFGGHVDAWFITHFDNDHVDAFNEIYADLQGIVVDQIYITPLDYDYYMSTLREWDTPASYETFLNLQRDNKNVHELKRGDTFELCGLQIEVFNAYDEVVEKANQVVNDLPNIASLVFKVSFKDENVLFCGDCRTEAMADILIQEYRDKLQADYVQLGHHGNNSFPTYFYDVVNPKKVFFDAPQWLMEGDEYTAKELKEYFEEKDIDTWDYSQGVMYMLME